MEQGSLSKCDHRTFVLLEVLHQPLLAGLALVGGFWVTIHIVRVDLERHEAKSLKGGWLNDRHVVGRHNGRTGDIGPRTRTDVPPSVSNEPPDGFEKACGVDAIEQSKGVSTADKERVGALELLERVAGSVGPLGGDAHDLHSLTGECPVTRFVAPGKGDEENVRGSGQELFQRFLAMIEVATVRAGRVANEQKLHLVSSTITIVAIRFGAGRLRSRERAIFGRSPDGKKMASPSEPKTRADWVDRKLREAILSGELRPGEKLHTIALGKRWSVSPTPVREAFQRLAAEGLLEITPQRGARVAPVSLQDAYEVHELRVALEPLALRSAMKNLNDAWRDDLEAAYLLLARELERGAPDRGAIEEAHRSYHLALLSGCSSTWMNRLIDLLNSHIIRYWTLTAAPRRDTEHVLEEHRRLHSLVVTGKTEVAVAELTAHLQHALHSVAERMAEDESD